MSDVRPLMTARNELREARYHIQNALADLSALVVGEGDHDTEVDLRRALNSAERLIRSARHQTRKRADDES